MRTIRRNDMPDMLKRQDSESRKTQRKVRGRLLPVGYTFDEDDSGCLVIKKGGVIVATLTGDDENGQE